MQNETELNEDALDLLGVIAIDEICCENDILPKLAVVRWWNNFDDEDDCHWTDDKSLLWNILNCLRQRGKITQFQSIKISSIVERIESFIPDEDQ
jgi:hypothetical protein